MSTDDPVTRAILDQARRPGGALANEIAARVAYSKLSWRERRRTPTPRGWHWTTRLARW